MATGEDSGTWGVKANNDFSPLLESAICGYASPNFSSDANLTIAITNGTDSIGRYFVLNCVSGVSLTATRNLICPLNAGKTYLITNATTGGQAIQVIGSSGTGVTIPNGAKTFVYCDGTNYVYFISNNLPTRQVFTSGSAATYTTPLGCRRLFIRAIGGGSGGGGSDNGAGDGGASGAGGSTIFGIGGIAVTASGGSAQAGGISNAGGLGGTGGAGSASFRVPGQQGFSVGLGAMGGGSQLGPGATRAAVAAVANTGGGGNGGGFGPGAGNGGGGGGGGEYFEVSVNSPSATYSYTVGASGAGGTAGTGGAAGTAGGSGIIIVDEYY